MTKHEQALIHEVMLMAYEQGLQEGRRQMKRELYTKVMEWVQTKKGAKK